MAHLGPRAFSTISGEVVQVAAFILEPATCSGFRPIFFRLIDGNEEQKRNMLSVKTNSYQRLTQDELFQIPGCPLAYWASPTVLRLFSSLTLFGSIGETLQGMTTCDNDFYLRYWWEVSNDKLGIGFASREAAACSDKKWFPYTKGGAVRKWFGNDEHFVNWENNGRLLRTRKHPSEDKIWAHNFNLNHIFREGASYSSLSSGTFACRYTAPGSLFDQKGSMIFLPQGKSIIPFIGLFNSKIVGHITEILCPTLDFNPGSLLKVPVHPRVEDDPHLRDAVQQAIELSQLDWNTNETSPSSDFCNPLRNHNQSTVFAAWDAWQNTCVIRLQSMIRHEQEVNRCLLKIYDLEGEFSPDVSEEEMTLCRPEQEEDIKRLISYAIGCMMGRYSLDEPGLIYAHSGGEGFDPGQYETFPADTDGIIPITDFEWFEDDAANRLEGFIATAWPKEHLEENLKFIADSLGPNKGERPRETIRRYLSTGFYKHHLQLYKKRTIYWLFSSGKQRAFQCLVYLHRYNEGTLSRMRTEYVIPLIGKIKARIERLSEDIEQAGSTSHRRALQKEQDKLKAQLAELAPVEYQLEDRGKNMRAGSTFDEKLRYYADQRIKLDLDDGVKINYGKFGDLLAEVKAITGNTAGE
jgi:hypothetical protein